MDAALIILALTLIAYVPLAAVLLFVWWKYGQGEVKVSIARVTFLAGSFALIGYMLML
ncbi:MAG: hypothetical protein WC444_03490 [Candidatus Paceibacterota bacterium]